MSPALRVALSIAVMRLPCSDAAFSRSPRKTCTATLRGSRSVMIDSSSGSYSTTALYAALPLAGDNGTGMIVWPTGPGTSGDGRASGGEYVGTKESRLGGEG